MYSRRGQMCWFWMFRGMAAIAKMYLNTVDVLKLRIIGINIAVHIKNRFIGSQESRSARPTLIEISVASPQRERYRYRVPPRLTVLADFWGYRQHWFDLVGGDSYRNSKPWKKPGNCWKPSVFPLHHAQFSSTHLFHIFSYFNICICDPASDLIHRGCLAANSSPHSHRVDSLSCQTVSYVKAPFLCMC